VSHPEGRIMNLPTRAGTDRPLTTVVEETDEAFMVELDLPGVHPEDVSVELRDNELFVTGEIKERGRAGTMRDFRRP
jgi:HSP20 family molecular chaperone IbpA